MSGQGKLRVDGVQLASASAGIRYQGRDDVVVLHLVEGSQVAATFTKNHFAAAPVTVAREHLAASSPRVLLINAGNANAGTGKQGIESAQGSCEIAAQAFACVKTQVLPFSTGVIGEPMALEPFERVMPALKQGLETEGWERAAAAIMTTDTVPKLSGTSFEIAGSRIVIAGMAKGSGMIHPDMATMLAYIATDAVLAPGIVQTLLQQAVDKSFNRITVDGDTSTNDACVLIATGAAENPTIEEGTNQSDLLAFGAALESVCLDLAKQIVRDGEGATKFVEVRVINAAHEEEAHRVAQTVALSPLVKTALNASDPNWGRILAAVGRAGLSDLAVDQVEIRIGPELIASSGAVSEAYSEARVQQIMLRDEFDIEISLNRGHAFASVWTCDLSAEYVRINADYRS